MKERQLQIKLPRVPRAKQGREVPHGRKQWSGLSACWQPSKEELREANAYFAGLGLISLALTQAQAANAHNESHQPESRMREIRPYGSEGGAGFYSPFLPLCALGSERAQEGESPSLVELTASN